MRTTQMAPHPLNGNGEAARSTAESDFSWFSKEFDRLFNHFPPRIADFFNKRTLLDSPSLQPVMDVREMKDHWRIDAELPGVDEKDLEVTVCDGVLILKAEKRPVDLSDAECRIYRQQRVFGPIHSTLPLPAEIDPDKVKARLHQGVLTVTVPKTKKAQESRRKIAIGTG